MAYSFLENAVSSLLQSLPSSLLAKIQSSSRIKAISIVLLLLLVSFAMGWIAFFTSHKYLPLAVLGVFYGILLSYPATKLLGPRLQSALGGLLGGISLGNVTSKVTSGTTIIRSLSKFINTSVQQVMASLPGAQFLEDGIVICIWMTLVTMFLIIATNAYLGEGPAAVTPAGAVPPAEAAKGQAAGVQKI